jgi:hypothetical protein
MASPAMTPTSEEDNPRSLQPKGVERFCSRCTSIDLEKMPSMAGYGKVQAHHDSFKSLQMSALDGCPVCQLLLAAMVKKTLNQIPHGPRLRLSSVIWIETDVLMKSLSYRET